jgi:hypothetical protein
MLYQSATLAVLGALVAGCAQLNASETILSTNQKVAMISTPGDSVSPPTTLVLFAEKNGQYAPVATGFGQAPVPAFLAGAGSGIAVASGIYGAAKVAKPQVTNISSTNTGGNTNGTTTSTSAGNISTNRQVQQSAQTQQSNIQIQNSIANASNVRQGAAASNVAGP